LISLALGVSFFPLCSFSLHPFHNERSPSFKRAINTIYILSIKPGGDGWLPAGYNPFGYQITSLGKKYLKLGGSVESDVGRLLASLKSRKKMEDIQSIWLEIVRASKKGQSMRIYRTLDNLIQFCLDAGLID
jgi:hypothetical protein